MQKNVLIYDAECRLCVSVKDILEAWDRKKSIRFLPFQDKEVYSIVPDLPGSGCLDAMRYMDQEGRIFQGIDAFRAILYQLPGGFLIATIFYIPGFYLLAGRIYRWVAKNRYNLSGSTVPPEEERGLRLPRPCSGGHGR